VTDRENSDTSEPFEPFEWPAASDGPPHPVPPDPPPPNPAAVPPAPSVAPPWDRQPRPDAPPVPAEGDRPPPPPGGYRVAPPPAPGPGPDRPGPGRPVPPDGVTETTDRRGNFGPPPMRDEHPGGWEQSGPPRPPWPNRPPGGQPQPHDRPPGPPYGAGGPPTQQWGEPPARPGDPGRWGDGPATQGSAQWDYVDRIRSSELVPSRKLPPTRGWRRAVHAATFGLINLGQSPDERQQAELEAKIRTPLRGRYKIGVLGKGGTGKTTIAASIGSLLAELRQEDRVVAIDADTAFGKLGSRIDPNVAGSYWELAADRHLDTFADVRSRVGSNSAGLFVLAGERSTARRRVLDPAIYREATARLDNHFTISIVDCGSTMDSPVTQEALQSLDALIVVSSPWVDGASAAAQTMEWLANHGFTALLHRTVVVLNDSDGHADKRTRTVLAEQFGSRGQTVVEVPFDNHLRPGGVIDVDHELKPATRRRLIEIAAAIAENFPATTDRPRERR
jgi:MinD-like ATPase involved in chromosome partitioning or flagellar assembly